MSAEPLAASALSRPQRRRALAAIIGSIAIYGISIGLSGPLLALVLEKRGVGSTLIGLNTAMLAVAMLLFSPLIPRLALRFGYRQVMVWSVLAEAACFAVLPFADSLLVWFAVRLVMGASAIGLFITGETWLNELADEHTRARLLSVYNTVLALAFAGGPVLISVTGTDGALPFLTAAAIVLLAGIPLLTGPGGRPAGAEGKPASLLLLLTRSPALAAAIFLFAFIDLAAGPLLPLFGVRHGMSEASAALMLTMLALGNVVLLFPIGWLADTVDRGLALLLCAGATMIGALALPLLIEDRVLLWPMLFVWGGFFAGIYTVALTLVGQMYKGAELVSANATIGLIWGLGALTGPSVAGVAMELAPDRGLPWVIAAAAAAFLVLATIRHRQGAFRRPPADG